MHVSAYQRVMSILFEIAGSRSCAVAQAADRARLRRLIGSAIVACISLMVVLAPDAGRAHQRQSPYLDGVVPVTSPSGFVHPGVFVGLPQLEEVRRRIVREQEPQISIYRWMVKSKQGLINRKPVWDVYSDAVDPSKKCNPRGRNGCIMAAGFKGDGAREHTDLSKRNMSYQINSAYANALLYYYSGGEEKYARNAIRMLNAYAHTFKGFASSPANSHVGDLFAAWMAQTLVRAAEIIRYTYLPDEGDLDFDVDAFEEMLRTAFVPRLQSGTENVNNWRTSAAEGLMNIGIFLDDKAVYKRSLEIWRKVTPSYIYLKDDGVRPASLLGGSDAQLDCRWADNRAEACKTHPKQFPGLVYQNGQSQEICRDMWHASAGVGGIINAAETAFLQGDNLYGEEQIRIMTGLSYMTQLSRDVDRYGLPTDFCASHTTSADPDAHRNAFPDDWDSTDPLSVVVAENHYTKRLGVSFATIDIPGYPPARDNRDPIESFVKKYRSGPQDTYGYITAWQVLTHFEVGEGVPTSAPPLRPRAGAGTATKSGEALPEDEGMRVLLVVGLPPLLIIALILILRGMNRGRRHASR